DITGQLQMHEVGEGYFADSIKQYSADNVKQELPTRRWRSDTAQGNNTKQGK
ncbi:MAG: hypothetical protein QG639_454, partial [Patescibacteria group bacterium]|nr:hypothetical protein [Patescibacteria group bacterium]